MSTLKAKQGSSRAPAAALAALASLIVAAAPLMAHHGRGSSYDMGAELELVGTVRELVWRNPHVAILIDVADQAGDTVTWIIEHSNVSTLARQGYSRNTLRPGQPVTAVVNPGTSGEPMGLCRRIVLESGEVIFVRGAGVD